MSWKRLQNPVLQKRLVLRASIIGLVRKFFISQGFLEMETPLVVRAAGQEPYLDPFEVSFLGPKQEKVPAYLITSPEYAHKKLLAAGFKKTFEITRSFRGGEPWSGTHNPEFTMIEWYHAGVDYRQTMREAEEMVSFVCARMHQTPRASKKLEIPYQGKKLNIAPPWERLSMQKAWERYAKIKKGANICDRKTLLKLCREHGYKVKNTESYDDLFFKIFLTEVEPKLGLEKPTFLYDYPASMAALAQKKKNDPRWAERFEVYAAGIELGNAFSELTDAKEQSKRFREEKCLRRKLKKSSIPLDEDFLDALNHMPPSAGIAFGIDRLVMLLTDAKSIDEVIAFPAAEVFEKRS
ncbi:MAG: EF-P lysine aminoacylase EpmA [Patescibacteria group bacterium]